MGGRIFDSSVYIDFLRKGDSSVFGKRQSETRDRIKGEPLYLSSVVLEELYAGAFDQRITKLLGKLESDFEKINRLLVPNQSDWSISGQILSKIGQKYGFECIKLSRMTNDCLIAMTARRSGLTVVTLNAHDFRIISEFRPLKLEEIEKQ